MLGLLLPLTATSAKLSHRSINCNMLKSFENDDEKVAARFKKIHWRHEGRRELSRKDGACT